MSVQVLVGDCREMLATLPDESVQCVVTSPPYWGLRAYGTNPQVWGGDSDSEHAHEWSMPGSTCACGAWLGELGSEPTPELFVEHIVDVFRAVRRVLRKDGTLFLNLGDSYAGSGKGPTGHNGIGDQTKRQGFDSERAVAPGLKPKDLCGMPWRVALALQADGWYWRSTIVWAKKSCMPESVHGWSWQRHMEMQGTGVFDSDGEEEMSLQPCPGCPKCQENDGLVLDQGSGRPTNAWEPILLFSRSARYFWDADAVREPTDPDSVGNRNAFRGNGVYTSSQAYDNSSTVPVTVVPGNDGVSQGRNQRNVWDLRGEPMSDFWLLGPEPFPGAHFATFVTEIPRRCILAGTSEKGQCPHCGKPWARTISVAYEPNGPSAKAQIKTTFGARKHGDHRGFVDGVHQGALRPQEMPYGRATKNTHTAGWRPTCRCYEWRPEDHAACHQGCRERGCYPKRLEPIPQTVLDPFFGSGTTGLVADRLNRNCIGVELNPDYAEMARRRLTRDAPMFMDVAVS